MKTKCFKVTISFPDSDDCSDAYAKVMRQVLLQELNSPDDLPGEPWEVDVEPLKS